MKEFIIQNWKGLLLGLVCVANLILIIIKKTKIVTQDTIFEKVLVQLPVFIRKAEASGCSGVDKKTAVLVYAISYLSDLTGLSCSDCEKKYKDKISISIEDILSTPQKKENKIDEK